MTWGQLKEQAERAGTPDDAEIILIDDADFRYGVASAELNDDGDTDKLQLVMGDELDEED